MFVGIAGIIGAGKSTLTEGLANEYDFESYHEPVQENDYLDDFYEKPERWATIMQMHLLSKRFHQHQQIVWNSKNNKVVQDRTIYEDTIFARLLNEDGIIPDREYETYRDHFDIMRRFLVYPDLIVYLDVKPEIALERVKKRGRDSEKSNGVDLGYLQRLRDGYEEFMDEMSFYTNTMKLDWNDYQPLENVRTKINEKIEDCDRKHQRSLRRI
ncbi:MAG: deoxynucleoside kinase [Candidatus Magasanikbacteria bacterium]